MSQWARMVFQGLMESNQYLPLTACSPSLSLISLQDLAGNSGIEPRGTGEDKQYRLGQPRRPRDGQSVRINGAAKAFKNG